MGSSIRVGSHVERLFAIAGEMAGALRSHDWSRSSLGVPETWPQSLCTALGLCFSSPLPSAVLWGDRHLQIANSAFYATLGQAVPPQSLGQPLRQVAPGLWTELYLSLGQVKRMGEPVEMGRWQPNQPIGPHHGYACTLSPILDEIGGIGGVFVTLTWPRDALEVVGELEHHRTEVALRESEAHLRQANERFQLAATAINALIYDWNIFTNRVERTEGLTRILGYTLDEAEPTMEWWRDRIHPDDLPKAEQSLREAIAQGNRFSTEYRVLNRANRYVYVLDCGIVVSRDEQGNPTRVVGSTTDISATKQVEWERERAKTALRQREATYRVIGESLNYGIWTADVDGQFTYFSDAFLHLVGLSLEECKGLGWVQAIAPEEADATLRAWQTCVQQGDSWDRELHIRGVDGCAYTILSRGAAVQDEYGNTLYWAGINLDITHQKQAEVRLRGSEERYRAIVENAPDAILITSAEGRVIEVNPNTCHLLGYSEMALVGRSIGDFIVPDDLPRLKTVLAHLKPGETLVEQWTLMHRDGLPIPVEASHKRLADGRWQSFVRDIRDRKIAEAKLRSFAEANVIGILFGDIYGTIRSANDEFLRIVGYSREDLQADRLNWRTLTPPEFLPLDEKRVAEAQEKRACTPYEKEFIRRDGSRVPVLLGYSVLEPERVETVAFILDLTEQKRAEAERNQLLKREQVAREEAERANRIKDEFLAVLSHELRSPLNPILGWASLLQKRDVRGPALKQALEAIERNSKLQLRLIDDLLDVSRILRGKLRLEREAVDLKTVVGAALETVYLSAEAKGIQLETQIAAEVEPVLGDEGRLQQVVWNLLSNAVKFTPRGGRVEVVLEQVGSQARIRVHDTGKGIRPDFLPHVFDHFQQEDGTITRKFGGLGLGLAIVRYLTEMHGGKVMVESPGEGMGATFTIYLPVISQPLYSQLQETKNHESLLNLQQLKGLQILLVEDEQDSRDFIRFVLEQMGIVVTAVPSAKAAMAAFRDAAPQLLISDIAMPEMNGYALIQYVRSHPPEKGGQVPAIALTAYAGEGDAQKALRAGFQYHLPKPIVPQDLYLAIADLMCSDFAHS